MVSDAIHQTRPRKLLRLICPAFPNFNIYSGPARYTTALGPVCVATAARELVGWDVEVIDENNYHYGPRGADGKCDHEAIQQSSPADVVGFYGGLTSTIPRLYDLARLYSRLGAKVIAGGQHFFGENIAIALASGINVIVRGEGEKAIVELLPRLVAGQDLSPVAGLAYLDGDGQVVLTPERPLETCFEDMPIPDFSVLRYARMTIYPITGVRGCGMDCEFCTVRGKPRFSSPRRIMSQFAAAHEKHRAKIFFIVDDLFGQNRREAIELCNMLADYQKRMSVKFSVTVQIRLDRARDSELLAAMRSANIRMLAIGFESPIEEELRAMNKRLNPNDMIALAKIYRKAGFHLHGMFIFGYPMPEGVDFRMSAAERVRRFRRFIRKAHIDTLQVLLPVPLPGTAMYDRLEKQGRLLSAECIGLEYYDGNFPVFTPDEPMTPESMQAGARQIMRSFYGPRHLANVAMNILTLPTVVLWMHGLRARWNRWHRSYWGSIYRAGGWLLVRRWTAAFRKDTFLEKLAEAKRRLTATRGEPA